MITVVVHDVIDIAIYSVYIEIVSEFRDEHFFHEYNTVRFKCQIIYIKIQNLNWYKCIGLESF